MIGGLPSVHLYCFCILSIETFMLLHVVSMECLGTIVKLSFFEELGF